MRRVLTAALLAVSLLSSVLAARVSLAVTLPPQHAQFVGRVIELVNVERQRVGRQPLVANAALMQAAQDYAGVMGDGTCFSHACGSTLVQRINGSGYTSWTAAGAQLMASPEMPEALSSDR